MASKSVSRKNKGVASAVEQRTTRIRAKINSDYAARHPDRAKAERALRKAHAQAAADFGRKREGSALTHAKAQRVRQGAGHLRAPAQGRDRPQGFPRLWPRAGRREEVA